jgi:hypothetical protein
MPVLDGLETTRRLRANNPPVMNPQIPVVALTAGAMEDERQRCLDAGMNDFISKPVQESVLMATLQRILTPGQAQPATATVIHHDAQTAVALREAAVAIRGLPDGGVLAPWWFSPAIVWWSGKPCVGGTSHQSLPGIVDSCVFYLAGDEAEGGKILENRKVRAVIAYEPDRVVSNSEQILGRKAEGSTLAEQLYKKRPLEGVGLVFENRFFKVYEVAD